MITWVELEQAWGASERDMARDARKGPVKNCTVCKHSRRATYKELYEHWANNWCKKFNKKIRSDEFLDDMEFDMICCEVP